MFFNKLIVVFALAVVALGEPETLEQVDDDALLSLFRTEKYVIVLFSEYKQKGNY